MRSAGWWTNDGPMGAFGPGLYGGPSYQLDDFSAEIVHGGRTLLVRAVNYSGEVTLDSDPVGD
jgi:hypothetical protein